MLKFVEKVECCSEASVTLTLPFELRQKSRLRTKLDNGEDVGLMLPRGTFLRGGDCLRSDTDLVIKVEAAIESVSTAFTKDHTLLSRASYHLGNRHVPLQISDSWVRYLHDHVLDEMVTALGLKVFAEMAAFEPEGGAYSQASNHEQLHTHNHHD